MSDKTQETILKSSLYITELLAYVRGEECDVSLVNLAMSACDARPKYDVDGESITLRCLDGELRYCIAFLRRSFYLFDDFFSCHGGDITIPFTIATTARTLHDCSDIPLLIEVSQCLDYFQPKNPLLFLDYDPSGCSADVIRRHTMSLSEEDKKRANRLSSHPSLHLTDVLASLHETEWSFLLTNYDYSIALLATDEFNKHPSLNLCLEITNGIVGNGDPIILERDYRDDVTRSKYVSAQLEGSIMRLFAIIEVTDKRQLGKLMATFGIHHALLENEGDDSCLPYHIVPRLEDKIELLRMHEPNIKTFLGITIEDAFVLFLPIPS